MARRQLPDYLARLGGNTGYDIHPEETMADNFALLGTGRPRAMRGCSIGSKPFC